jgi:IgA peptidase M64/PKD domain-containing protein/putative Ig domain-containing protein/Big-like domain-containing protein/flagellar hook capping protein FlgD
MPRLPETHHPSRRPVPRSAGIAIALACLVLGIPPATAAGPPGRMLGFQGHLRDEHGKAISGAVDLVFRLYDAPRGGNILAGPYGPIRVVPSGGEYSTGFGPVPIDRLRGPKWLEITASGTVQARQEMETAYYDWIDESGRLAGGQTLVSSAAGTLSGGQQSAAVPVTTILNNGPTSNRIDIAYVGDGYLQSELPMYAINAQSNLDALLSQEPFAGYRTFFNAHRVDVVSNESGVDNDPVLGITRDTALNMGFYCGGTARLLCVDFQKANQFASAAPAADLVFALANSTTYGGSGYTRLAAISGGNLAAAEIGVHETGHSLGGLADEYEYDGPAVYTGAEPQEPNVSTLPAPSMAASGAKWARWLGDPGIGYGGLVGTYEGGFYSQFGIYRPTLDSKMRSLGQPFNLPSVESLILQFYQYVRPIDNATPAGTQLDEFSTAFVDPVAPPEHPLAIRWYIDGTPVPGATGKTFHLCTGTISLGDHVLAVSVQDTTSLVRDENQRKLWMTESRFWDLHIGGSNGDCAPIVTAPAGADGDEGLPLSFTVSATDPNGDVIDSFVASGGPLTHGATFQSDPSHTSGTFQWTPGYDQAGTHLVTFTAGNAVFGSASTPITIRNVNVPPSISAPAQVNGAENASIAFNVVAQDPDGETVAFLTEGVPPGATFLDHENNVGEFSWVPGFDQAGDYPVTFTARDGSGATAGSATRIHVDNVDRPPRIDAPQRLTGDENQLLEFAVTVTDADAESAAPSLTAGTLPEGATFTPEPQPGVGTFHWTPGFHQAGAYAVTFTAANALTASVTTAITVRDVDRPPALDVPAEASAAEGTPWTLDATASDPDEDPITAIEASGLPPGAAFTPDIGHGTARIAWTPAYDQAGSYHVTLSASSASRASPVSGAILTGSAEIAITVANTDRPPGIVTPLSVNGSEGVLLALPVSAVDPDGEGIASLEADLSGLPAGDAVFEVRPDHAAAELRWSPTYQDGRAAPYLVPIRVSNALEGAGTLMITIADVNRAPAADPGGPYYGAVGIPLAFHGEGSSDPDGQPLRSDWAFGDGTTGTGPAPQHTYAASGSHSVTLTVTDDGLPPLAGSASTTATIQDALEARAFLMPSRNQVIRLMSSNDWCAQLEPVGGDFEVEDVDVGTEILKYGSSQISALSPKSTIPGDLDRNGIQDFSFCFDKNGLRGLLGTLPPGRTSVDLTLEAALRTGGRVRGLVTVDVVASPAHGVQALTTPNPGRPATTLTFTTTQPGPVRVRLFDSRGRLVRSLLQSTQLGAGYHDIAIDGSDDAGRRLPSGVYFYRIESLQGVAAGRVGILR